MWASVLADSPGRRAGAKKTMKVEADDIAAGLDDMRYDGYGDADDDVDFM